MAKKNHIPKRHRHLVGIIVRRVYRGEALSAEDLSWVRTLDAESILSARRAITRSVFNRMIATATSTPLFDNDASLPSAAAVVEDLTEWAATSMTDELGPEAAAEYLERVASDIRWVY